MEVVFFNLDVFFMIVRCLRFVLFTIFIFLYAESVFYVNVNAIFSDIDNT